MDAMARLMDLEIGLLRAFVAVAQTGGFTTAADAVRCSQSTISQKVSRLEERLGVRLFERTSRSLHLTHEGERFLVLARQMIDLNDRAARTFSEMPASGHLRLGVCEDFVPMQLPSLLSRFRRLYPDVQLELRTGLSCNLLAAYDDGQLDAVIAKKDGNARRGRVIWREPLVWMAARDMIWDEGEPVPLVLLPPPCTYRDVMIAALDAARRPWTISCTAHGLMGVQAAVAGGLGVTVLGRCFIQPGLSILPPSERWPSLPATEIVLLGEDAPMADLVRPLVGFLVDELAGAGAPQAA